MQCNKCLEFISEQEGHQCQEKQCSCCGRTFRHHKATRCLACVMLFGKGQQVARVCCLATHGEGQSEG